jgi:hypothetical protein
VAGVDTIRGIGFQQACALGDAVDLAVNPAAARLRVEGVEDVVDYETLGTDGQRLRVRQAKTRQAPRTWSAGEIAAILDLWVELPDAANAEFAFVTDGQLGKSGVALERIIEAAKAHVPEAELQAMASRIAGTTISLPPSSLLRRVELLTGFGTLSSVLERLELRVLRLMERGRVVTTEDARAVVDRLFRMLFVIGGKRQPQRREATRPQVFDLLGLTEEEVMAGGAWDTQARDTYRARLRDQFPPPDVIVLDVLRVHAGPRVLRLLEGPIEPDRPPEPPEALLDPRQVVLIGPTGRGKTTTLATLRRLAADRGDLPVLLPADGHVPGALSGPARKFVRGVLAHVSPALLPCPSVTASRRDP